MDERDLTDLLCEQALRHLVPGAGIGILRDGEAVTAYTGVADTATGEPVSLETRFAIGSLCLVATEPARLAGSGELSLDDPVSANVPELRGAEWAARASVRDLLANRSRVPLRAEFEFSAFPGDDAGMLARFVERLSTVDPMPPVWSYANAGWCVLGRVLETVTALSWEDAMRVVLFEPLEMEQTTFGGATPNVPRAAGHEVTSRGVLRAEPWTPRAPGAGGLDAPLDRYGCAAVRADASRRPVFRIVAGV